MPFPQHAAHLRDVVIRQLAWLSEPQLKEHYPRVRSVALHSMVLADTGLLGLPSMVLADTDLLGVF